MEESSGGSDSDLESEDDEWMERSFHKKYAGNKMGINIEKLDDEALIAAVKFGGKTIRDVYHSEGE